MENMSTEAFIFYLPLFLLVGVLYFWNFCSLDSESERTMSILFMLVLVIVLIAFCVGCFVLILKNYDSIHFALNWEYVMGAVGLGAGVAAGLWKLLR